MNSSRAVVVGVDDKQPHAVKFALEEATRTGSELIVVHSAGLPGQTYETYSAATLFASLRDAGQAILDLTREMIDSIEHDVPVRYVLSPRAPAGALEQEARDARLLVIGTEKASWFERLLGGAIAEHLVRHAAVPVVVVPERDHHREKADVVVMIDGNSAARGPLRFAFDAATARNGVLHVLHATPPGTAPEDALAAQAAVSEVLAGWRAEFPDVQVRTEFVTAHPPEACLEATASAGLVVLGRPSGRPVPLALARPVAAQVVRRAKCPVVIIPLSFRSAA
ncbi:MAG: universal stress protein [Nocardioides sp.]|nr:universal stress protein [Nocardioides sp.]